MKRRASFIGRGRRRVRCSGSRRCSSRRSSRRASGGGGERAKLVKVTKLGGCGCKEAKEATERRGGLQLERKMAAEKLKVPRPPRMR